MIEVEAGGQVFEFPDGTPEDVMREALTRHFQGTPEPANAAPDAPAVSTAEDVARSAATGVRSGLEAVAGLPGDAREQVTSLLNFVLDKAGVGEDQRGGIIESAFKATPFGFAPTTEQVEGVTESLVGDRYEPQTTAGEYARTGGEFISGAAAPGGVVRKAAMVALPAVASETAGQLTEGTEAEPYARFTAALLGGGIAAKGRAKEALKALPDTPSLENVKAATDTLYSNLRNAGVQYDPSAYGNFAQGLANVVKRKGYRKGTAPKSFSLLDEIVENVGNVLDFDDLDSIRKSAGQIARNDIDATERGLARKIVQGIDQFEARAPLANGSGIPKADFNKIRKEARELASRKIKAEQISELVEKAKTYQSGFESGLRNQFSNFERSKKIKSFTPEEKKAIQSVAKGDFTNNALGSLGRFGVDFGNLGNRSALIPGLSLGGAAAAGEPITGALTVGLGTIAKLTAKKGTKNAADEAVETVLRGKSGQMAASKAKRLENQRARIRALIAGESASRPVRPPAVEQLGYADSQ